MKKDVLSDYLATGKYEAPVAVVNDAAIVQVSATSPMEELLKKISATAMVAKDLHYKAHGKPFLANHELADMIAEIEKNKDTINEIYYMGEQQSNPPLSIVICGGAVEIVRSLYGDNSAVTEEELIGYLHSLCQQVTEEVERVKGEGEVKSGTQAVLDEVSKDALQYAGFLKNVLNGMGSSVDADSPDATGDGATVEVQGEVVAPTPEEAVETAEAVEAGAEATEENEAIEAAENEEVEEDEDDKSPAERYMGLVNK